MSLTLEDLFPGAADHERETKTVRRRRRRTDQDREEREQQRRRKRRRRVTVVVILAVISALLIPIALVAGFYLTAAETFNRSTDRIEDAFPAVRAAPSQTEALNILLIGSDTRGALGDVLDEKATGQRADTMMLVHISADREHVAVISLMRDLWVDIPGHPRAKLNAAFAWGGTPLTIQTIEQLFGARIDHVAVIDFGGFGDMTTALGGVDVYSEYAFTSRNMPGFTFAQGMNHLEGNAALAFVRERYSFNVADYQRVKNQREFVKGILNGLLSRDTLLNPGSLMDFVAVAASHTAVDSGLDFNSIVGLGLEMRELRLEDVSFFTLPTLGTGTSADGQSIVVLDAEQARAIGNALTSDGLAEYLSAHDVRDRP